MLGDRIRRGRPDDGRTAAVLAAVQEIDADLRRATGLPPAQPWPELIRDSKRAVADGEKETREPVAHV